MKVIREAVIHYVLLTENGDAWKRTEDMIRNLAPMKRDNEAARASLKEELQYILVNTHGALEFLEGRGLPLPVVPERWLEELRKNDAEIVSMADEFEGKGDA